MQQAIYTRLINPNIPYPEFLRLVQYQVKFTKKDEPVIIPGLFEHRFAKESTLVEKALCEAVLNANFKLSEKLLHLIIPHIIHSGCQFLFECYMKERKFEKQWERYRIINDYNEQELVNAEKTSRMPRLLDD